MIFLNTRRAAATLVLFAGFWLAGCGGSTAKKRTDLGGGNQGSGSVRLTVQWPTRTGRIVPLASESIVVVFQDASRKELTRATATRPDDNASTSELRFTPVPVGDYFAAATAYPQSDGSGVAQAQASLPLSVAVDTETVLDVSLQSAIASLTLTQSATVGAQSVSLVPTARNAAGATVLTRPAQFAWSSSDETVATVDVNGVVTAVGAGRVTITARDTESGTTAQAVVTTNAP